MRRIALACIVFIGTFDGFSSASAPVITDVEIILIDGSLSDYLKLRYSILELPPDRGMVIQNRELALIGNITNGMYVGSDTVVATNSPSSAVRPIRLRETPSGDSLIWSDYQPLAERLYAGEGRYGYDGFLTNPYDVIVGFKHLEADGIHFGWARVHGQYSLGTFYQIFDTNSPPTFPEVVVNPVPWAETILGRKSSGGPTLTNSPLPGSQLRLSYPGWCDRYAIRQRSRPKGEIVKVFPSGREGLVATNGYYSIDVPMSGEAGLFELFLPPVNRMP